MKKFLLFFLVFSALWAELPIVKRKALNNEFKPEMFWKSKKLDNDKHYKNNIPLLKDLRVHFDVATRYSDCYVAFRVNGESRLKYSEEDQCIYMDDANTTVGCFNELMLGGVQFNLSFDELNALAELTKQPLLVEMYCNNKTLMHTFYLMFYEAQIVKEIKYMHNGKTEEIIIE